VSVDTIEQLHDAIRERFPAISEKADVWYDRNIRVNDNEECLHYLWIEQLANAVNDEMIADSPPDSLDELFLFFDSALAKANAEVHDCIDVAFVEN
jgi:hypothetical protein